MTIYAGRVIGISDLDQAEVNFITENTTGWRMMRRRGYVQACEIAGGMVGDVTEEEQQSIVTLLWAYVQSEK